VDGTPAPTAHVMRVAPEIVRPLRQAVLRPHQTVADQVYPGDAVPGAAHFAAFAGDATTPVGVASIVPEGFPGAGGARPGDWRVRGMATDPDGGRGIGAGALLLRACLDHARAAGAARVWCNARAGVRGFYEREGFVVEGDEFTLPAIGPHFLMSLTL
jgi:predicted GNAT family N-acyltransferase